MLEVVFFDYWNKDSWSIFFDTIGEQRSFRADRLGARGFVKKHAESIYICLMHPDILQIAKSKVNIPNIHNLYDLLDDKHKFSTLADELGITYAYPIKQVTNTLKRAFLKALATNTIKRKELSMADTNNSVTEEVQVDYSKWSIWRKIAKARELFALENIEKTGKNNFLKCRYFQLEDIVPAQMKIFTMLGLFEHFTYSPEIREYDSVKNIETIYPAEAISKVINVDKPSEYLEFKSKWVDGTAQTPIQAVGSAQTYLRRYNKMQIFDLVETEAEDNEATSRLYVSQQEQNEKRKEALANLADPNKLADSVMCKQVTSTIKKLKEEFKDNAEVEKLLKEIPAFARIKNGEITQEEAHATLEKAATLREKLTSKEK